MVVEGAMSAGFDMRAGSGEQAGTGLRVSDAERDGTAAELREHYAAGRLSLDELNERISQAFAAKTRGDLDAVMHDLPSLRPGGTAIPGYAPPGAGQPPSAGAGWTGQDRGRGPWSHQDPGSGGAGQRGPWGPGHAIGVAISAVVALCLLAGLGVLAAAGFGTGDRPFIIVALLAALALLRRLFFGRARRARRGRARRARTRRGARRY
jgi:hypothetical protein